MAAGALWGPYLVEPKERVRAWALETFSAFAALAAGNTPGVRMTAGVEASRRAGPPPDFADMVPGLQAAAAHEVPAGFAAGVRYTAPLVDMAAYLAYLRPRLQDAGGTASVARGETSARLIGLAPIVVDCTGIGAHHPVPGTAAAIIQRCAAVEPRIAAAKVLAHRAGLRPTRPAIRLDAQNLPGCQVVHCYGHGGAGMTLSWGCATEVRELVGKL